MFECRALKISNRYGVACIARTFVRCKLLRRCAREPRAHPLFSIQSYFLFFVFFFFFFAFVVDIFGIGFIFQARNYATIQSRFAANQSIQA